jgi:hypothetical protein
VKASWIQSRVNFLFYFILLSLNYSTPIVSDLEMDTNRNIQIDRQRRRKQSEEVGNNKVKTLTGSLNNAPRSLSPSRLPLDLLAGGWPAARIEQPALSKLSALGRTQL